MLREAEFRALCAQRGLSDGQIEAALAVGRGFDEIAVASGESTCRTILAGNHHGVPAEPFLAQREVLRAEGLEAVLRHRHERLVAQLAEHARTGLPWYEQIITAAVVDMGREDPEIEAGVLCGGFTKWPFDVIFGEQVRVELLERALGGDESCRLCIEVPERFLDGSG